MMTIGLQSTKIAIALITTFAVSQASAESASSTDEEIDAGAGFDGLAMRTQIAFESDVAEDAAIASRVREDLR
jgi:hypothetical protein